jgi:hypothetical protein
MCSLCPILYHITAMESDKWQLGMQSPFSWLWRQPRNLSRWFQLNRTDQGVPEHHNVSFSSLHMAKLLVAERQLEQPAKKVHWGWEKLRLFCMSRKGYSVGARLLATKTWAKNLPKFYFVSLNYASIKPNSLSAGLLQARVLQDGCNHISISWLSRMHPNSALLLNPNLIFLICIS